MLKTLRQYTENGMKITEYTRDGETASHRMEAIVSLEIPQEEIKTENQPSLEEIQTQVLLNTEYLVIMSELTNI